MASKKVPAAKTKSKTLPAAKTKSKKVAAKSGTGNAVDAFLSGLDHPRKAEIEALRKLILGVDRRIEESIKWNAPSFAIGEHFATFKLRPGDTVQVVFHTGAKVKPGARPITIDDPSGMLVWAAKDRCVATLADLADIRARKSAFVAIVEQWIEQM